MEKNVATCLSTLEKEEEEDETQRNSNENIMIINILMCAHIAYTSVSQSQSLHSCASIAHSNRGTVGDGHFGFVFFSPVSTII